MGRKLREMLRGGQAFPPPSIFPCYGSTLRFSLTKNSLVKKGEANIRQKVQFTECCQWMIYEWDFSLNKIISSWIKRSISKSLGLISKSQNGLFLDVQQ